MLRNIHLHGSLATTYGSCHRMAVDSPGEAVRALSATLPGFFADFRAGRFRVVRGDLELGLEHINMLLGAEPDLHIVPVPVGAKNQGVGKVLLGVAIIAFAWWAAPAAAGGGVAWGASTGFLGISYGTLALVGASIALGGVALMMTPMPEVGDYGDREERRPSFLFNGPVNRTEQGGPVPLVYGQAMAGSVVVSSGLFSEIAPLGTSGFNSWAVEFDGTDGHIDLGMPSHLFFPAPFGVQVYAQAYSLSATTAGDPLISYGAVGAGGWELSVESNGSVINLAFDGISNHRVTLNTPLVVNKQYRISVEMSRALVQVWINGEKQDNTPSAPQPAPNSTTEKLYIGRSGAKRFNGIIDDVSISKGVNNYALLGWFKTFDPDAMPANVVGYWRLNEGFGTDVADEFDLANGTLVSGAKWIVPPYRLEDEEFKIIMPKVQERDR